MNNRYRLLLLSVVLMSASEMLHAKMQPIIMLFDWKYEKPGSGFNAMTLDLKLAVAQEAAPILVSGSLWRNFLESKILPSFNPARWTMKKITTNGSLYLLVPKNNADAQKGLQLTAFSDASNITSAQAFPTTGVNNLDNELLAALKKLFVPKPVAENAVVQDEWLIYLGGHGEKAGDMTSGLQEQTFKKLLTFFNNKIATKFLFYITCSAGGERLISSYETKYDVTKGISENRADVFNYTIVSAISFYIKGATFSDVHADFRKGFAALQKYFQEPTQSETMSSILQYLQPTFLPKTLKSFDESLDIFLGNKGDALYKVPLYFGEGAYVKKIDKNGEIKIQNATNLYRVGGEIFIDPTIQGAVELEKKDIVGSGPGDLFFLTQDQKNKNQTAQLVIKKNTGSVVFFKDSNTYVFMWDPIERLVDRIRELQVPAIRFPGTGWFSTSDVDQKVQRISRIEALTAWADNKPLVTMAKQIVIFDTQSPLVPSRIGQEEHAAIGIFAFKLQPMFKYFPQIMLMAPTDAQLYFEKIDAEYGCMALLNGFMPLQEYKYARTFYAKKIICNNDLTGQDAQKIGAQSGAKLELDDVMIFSNASPAKNEKRSNGVRFTYKGKTFSAIWPASDVNAYKMLQEKKGLPFLTQANYPFVYPYSGDLTAYTEIASVKKALEKQLKQGPPPEELSTQPQQQQPEQPPKKPTQPEKPVTPPPAQNGLAHKLQALTQALQQLRNALAGT